MVVTGNEAHVYAGIHGNESVNSTDAYTVGFQSTILRRIKFSLLIICMKKKKKIAQTNSGKFEWAVMERKCFQIEINNGSLR